MLESSNGGSPKTDLTWNSGDQVPPAARKNSASRKAQVLSKRKYTLKSVGELGEQVCPWLSELRVVVFLVGAGSAWRHGTCNAGDIIMIL